VKREPLITTAGITAGVTAAIALLVAFGVDLTTEQQTAILGAVAVLAPLAVGTLARSKVAPWLTVVEQVAPDGSTVQGPASAGR